MTPETVIALDPIVTAFIAKNMFTLTLGIGFLKAIAVLTPWATDDKIISMLQSALSGFKTKGK